MDPDRLIQWRPQQWRSIYSPNKPAGERGAVCCLQPIYLYVWDINRTETPPPHLCCFLLWLNTDESTWQAIYLFVFLADKCLSAFVCLPVWLPVHICNVMFWCFVWGSSLFAFFHEKGLSSGVSYRSASNHKLISEPWACFHLVHGHHSFCPISE